MNIEKTYIISYVKNDDKRNHIKSILHDLSINNYEFIYGVDMHISDIYKISIYDEKDGNNFIIENDNADTYASHAISCGIAHFTALEHAYYSNLNNCLIIEDDVLLYKDKDYVNKVLTYYPIDADIVQYGFILFDKDYN
jgi:GR25 family glycosyltransferase involved in LPS biosynthesis